MTKQDIVDQLKELGVSFNQADKKEVLQALLESKKDKQIEEIVADQTEELIVGTAEIAQEVEDVETAEIKTPVVEEPAKEKLYRAFYEAKGGRVHLLASRATEAEANKLFMRKGAKKLILEPIN